MNYRSAKKKKQKQKQGLLFALVVFLVVLGFSGVYRWVSIGSSPIARSFWKFADGDTRLSFIVKDKRQLQRQVSDLESQVQTLKLELVQMEVFQKQNEEFKNALGRSSQTSTILAGVLVKPSHTLYDTVVVDAGTDAGVLIGDTVIAYGNVAIGKVVDVKKNISYVELFSQNNVESKLLHIQSGIFVDAIGQGGSMLSFEIPRDLEIAENDILVLPGIDGYLVGKVEKIKFNATDPFQTIFARSGANINHVNFVEIIHGYGEQF